MIKIGQSMHPGWVNGDLNKLDDELRLFKEAGAESCELVLHGLDVIIGARLIAPRLEAVIGVMRKYDLGYTLHMPHGLNLLDTDNIEMYIKIFRSAIEFARAAGIKLINYHAGMKRIDDKKKPDRNAGAEWEAPPDANSLIRNEIEQIKSLAKDAPDIMFCMENALFGGEPVISAASRVEDVIEFYNRVDLPNFKLTFDIGHSFLFNNGNGADLLRHMERLLPYVSHIHLHDNCGTRTDIKIFEGGHRLIFGAGDIHLPLGWGNLPVDDALAMLKDYNGIINLEIEQRFSGYYKDCIAQVRELLF